MNFTGRVQRQRNINLGGRSVTGSTRDSLLRRAQQERDRREATRKQENAAIIIQTYYKSRREVALLKAQILDNWLQEYKSTFKFDSIQSTESYVRQFTFGLETSTPLSVARHAILDLDEVLSDTYNQKCLLEVANSNSYLFNQFVAKLVKCGLSGSSLPILSLISRLYQACTPDTQLLILDYVASAEKSTELFESSDSQTLENMLERTTRDFPCVAIAKYLCDDHLFERRNPNIFKPILVCVAVVEQQGYSPRQVIAQLANVVYLVSFMDSTFGEHINLIKGLLSQIHGTIEFRQSNNGDLDSEDSDNETEVESSMEQIILDPTKPSDQFIVNQISQLYTRECLRSLFRVYNSDDGSTSVADLATTLAELIRILPKKRKDLMLHLSVSFDVPAVHVFWHSFKLSTCYSSLVKGAPSSSNLVELFSSHPTEWVKLQLVLDLYSYWLIIADDDEFLRNNVQGLARDEAQELSSVLKHLCFALIWHWNKIESMNSKSVSALASQIKSLAILVTRQIYVRDSRRPFLPKNFWLMTSSIDMERFIPQVVEEEQKLQRIQESEEEESETQERTISRTTASYQHRRKLMMTNRASQQRIVAPRLEILRQVPFFMPFQLRVHIFQEFIKGDKEKRLMAAPRDVFSFGLEGRVKGVVRRENLLEDALDAFGSKGASDSTMHDKLSVTFYSNGLPEAGIDGGGLTKEFLTSVCSEGFSDKNGLFLTTNDHRLYPNPVYGVNRLHSNISDSELTEALQYYEFLGEVIGKCLYDETLVDVDFAPFFLQKWAGRASKNSFDDLYSLDPDIYKNLVYIRNFDFRDDNPESDLGLNFALTQDVGHGMQKSIELVPAGEQKSLNSTNKLEYIHAVAHYKINVVLSRQTNAFLTGLNKLVALQWLSMFNSSELQMLISGGSAPIDLDDLYNNTEYGGYGPNSPTVAAFWSVVRKLREDDKRELIKFVTSVPKAPLLGFSQLYPKFAIRNGGSDTSRLPTASTCVNLLKLPDYKSEDLLKEKLLYAIRAGAGFDLS